MALLDFTSQTWGQTSQVIKTPFWHKRIYDWDKFHIEKENPDLSFTGSTIKMLKEISLQGIRISDSDRILSYLIGFPGLIDVVGRASTRIIETLQSTSQYFLEINTDAESDFQTLQLIVRQTKYEPDLVSILDSINMEFENDLRASDGWFLITTDFRNPIP